MLVAFIFCIHLFILFIHFLFSKVKHKIKIYVPFPSFLLYSIKFWHGFTFVVNPKCTKQFKRFSKLRRAYILAVIQRNTTTRREGNPSALFAQLNGIKFFSLKNGVSNCDRIMITFRCMFLINVTKYLTINIYSRWSLQMFLGRHDMELSLT